MGSYDSAVMTGFLCRLCSELKQNVLHIYSDKGIEMKLTKKIRSLPLEISPDDSLPKTVCRKCIKQLDNYYQLVHNIRRSQRIHRFINVN